MCIETPKFFWRIFKNSKQVKSKQDRSDERWYPKQASVNIQTLESLILAQDER